MKLLKPQQSRPPVTVEMSYSEAKLLLEILARPEMAEKWDILNTLYDTVKAGTE